MKRQLRPDPIHEDESYETIVKIMLFTIAPVILSTAIYNISQVLDQLLFRIQICSIAGNLYRKI